MERVKVLPSGCWKWHGATSKEGYGVLQIGGKQRFARRVFWEWFVGEIPKDQVVALRRHAPECIGRVCCNPDHLLVRDRTDPVRWPTCPNGHRLIPSSIMVENQNGSQVERCRLCRLDYWKTRKARQRAAT